MAYIALNIKGLPVADLHLKARRIVDCLTEEQAFFNDLPVSLNDLEKLLKEYQKKITKAIQGAHRDIVMRNECTKIVKKTLTNLAGYVQIKSDGDESIILRAGMDIKKTGSYIRKSVSKPIGLRFKHTNNVDMPMLHWQCDRNVMNYIEITQTPNEPDSWRRYAFTGKKKLQIKGLQSDHVYWFRVMSITTAAVSDFSDAVKKVIG